jgi:hypothetical protein
MTQAATSNNTASTLVLRDASKNFSCNNITLGRLIDYNGYNCFSTVNGNGCTFVGSFSGGSGLTSLVSNNNTGMGGSTLTTINNSASDNTALGQNSGGTLTLCCPSDEISFLLASVLRLFGADE